jgi:hypothetical protein
MKKQEKISVEAANGFKIIIDKYTDPRNIKLFQEVVIKPNKKGGYNSTR